MADQPTGPKTVPLKKTTSIPLKKETVRVSVKADPVKAPSSSATPPPLPTAASVKTVPLTGTSAPTLGSAAAPAPSSAPSPDKTIALGGVSAPTPTAPIAGTGKVPVPGPATAPLAAPTPSAPLTAPSAAPVAGSLKTQQLSAPAPTAPAIAKTQPLAPNTAPLTATPTTPAAIATKAVASRTAPTMTRGVKKVKKTVKSRWPVALFALLCAMGLCGMTIWEFYSAVGRESPF